MIYIWLIWHILGYKKPSSGLFPFLTNPFNIKKKADGEDDESNDDPFDKIPRSLPTVNNPGKMIQAAFLDLAFYKTKMPSKCVKRERIFSDLIQLNRI